MGKILEAYLSKYGGEEKKASTSDVDAVFASIFGTEKVAEVKEDGEKVAAVYEALGRRLAREAWAAEAAGVEKEASEEAPAEEVQKVAAELINEMLSGEEKTASDELAEVLGEKPAEDEVKTAAQVHVLEGVIKAACAGNEKAAGLFEQIKEAATAASPSLRQKLVAALKNVASATKGGLDAVRNALVKGKGKAVAGAKAVGSKAKAIGGKAVGAAKEVGQVAKAFPGASAAMAGAGVGIGALGAYALSRRKKD
jgi:hypothetical protein